MKKEYLKILNYNKAFECSKEILKYNPCSNQALLNMAYIAYSQENYLTSLEYIKEFSKYAFDNTMIFEAYQILVDIYLGLDKYDYAAIFAYIGSSFTDNEDYEKTMYDIYLKYKGNVLNQINSVPIYNGINNLAIGTDFYGTKHLPKSMKNYNDISNKLSAALKSLGYTEKAINSIFFDNANKFLINS